MPELTVISGPATGTSISLSEDEAYTIGSARDASLHVAGDDVAARHVVIKALKGGGFGLKGLAGPVRINGRPVEAARLEEGDTLELGSCRIRFGQAIAAPRDGTVAGRSAAEGTELGGFRLLGVLGQGGMGTVHRALQVSLNREVALKVLSKELTADPVFVARFQAEARAAARLHHPNVVQVFDVDHEGDTYFYSMELMHAGSLEKRLRAEGRVPVDEAIEMIADAARGLGFAESMRIVHRDIKPDNLMVDQHGHVKLADLGLALTEEEQASKVVGTPHFMSPEQVQRRPLDQRSDLYSLGCTFYRLVTGQTPFKGDSVKQILLAHVKEEPVAAHRVNPDVPAEVGAIIGRLLQKDPAERYQSADELVAELEHLRRPPVRKGLLIGSAAVAVLVAAGAIYWAATRPEPETRIITQKITDPAALAELEKYRVLLADKELIIVELRALDADALTLAAALDAMAKEYANTPAAARASERAAKLRAEDTRRTAKAAEREQAIEAATARLRADFEQAASAGDLAAAARVLTGERVQKELRQEEAVARTLRELGSDLERAGVERLDRLRTAVDEALARREPDALRAAIARLDAVVADDGGWPAAALPDRAPVDQMIAVARRRADLLDAELTAAARAAAWTTLRRGLLADDGVAAAVVAMRLGAAADRLGTLCSELDGTDAGARAAGLGPALQAAVKFLRAFTAAANSGRLQVRHHDDEADGMIEVPVVGFSVDGANPGLTVKLGSRTRSRQEVLPLLDLQSRLGEVFVLPGERQDGNARAAFLATQALFAHLRAARRYLASLGASDDLSGTGAGAYPLTRDQLAEAQAALSAVPEDWARSLGAELRAADLLVRGLRALSTRQNLSCAGLVERLLRDHPDSIVVHCLR